MSHPGPADPQPSRARRWMVVVLLLLLALFLFRAPGRAITAGILAAGRQLPQAAMVAAGLFTVGRLLLLLLVAALVFGLLRGRGDGR